MILASGVNWTQDKDLLYLMLTLNSISPSEDLIVHRPSLAELIIRTSNEREGEGDLTDVEREQASKMEEEERRKLQRQTEQSTYSEGTQRSTIDNPITET